MSGQVGNVLSEMKELVRQRLDPLGCEDFGNGAFQSGHVPHIAPLKYLVTCYAGLDNEDIEPAEADCSRRIPQPYRDFLTVLNGAHILGISLNGFDGRQIDRSGAGIGQPVSLRYDNLFRAESYIPEGHFGFGAINGPWYSQGVLYLASTGEVEMYHRDADLIGARWPSFADFLTQEIPRRFSLFNVDWTVNKEAKLLPGDTADWERIGEEHDKRRKADHSVLGKAKRLLKRS
ncbi:hypothetical protein ATO10_13409 [Actibacterium atlanticum]|uniref:Knr4/Smi1-like domain-containing protein n=1 Tax=Actibacterium atlanticum TaxID=1461693 RepID=A0A058ZK66_9RHOB|nr:SMI1/KNR4 family protein [Actibacterium atlanticum]KCV81181.1 hypothetical protein ATO10_13409 [Actibacterium atlanticum]